MIKYFLYLLTLIFFLSVRCAYAQETLDNGVKPTQTNPQEYSAINAWLTQKHLLGGWYGFRKNLEDHGLDFEASYTTDSLIKMSGGLNSEVALRPISLLNFSVTVDTGKYKLPGGKLYILGQNVHGEGLTQNFVGSIQPVSGIEAQPLTQVGEAWYEQKLLKDKIRTKIGKQDANTEFDLLPANTNFVCNSFILSPNILVPTYPNQSLGIETIAEPVKWFDAKAGFFASINVNEKGVGIRSFFSGGHTTLAQVEFKPSIKNCPGNYMAGYWFNSSDVDGVGSQSNKVFGSNTGFYTAFQQMIYKESKKDDDGQGLSVQGQFAWDPSNKNVIAQYYGAAMTYTGLLPRRNQDSAGIGTAIAVLSKELDLKNETILELYYKAQLTPFFAIQPDMQFVFNPGGDHKNAFVMGVRTVISF